MAGCLIITLPLELLWARVYRQPKRLLFALLPPLVVFGIWDVIAVARDHWSFNSIFVTGWELPGAIPVEELIFFVVIPICTLLTYESVRRLLPKIRDRA